MWLANFPMEAGFDISKASIDAKARSWTYNMEGGVFCRSPDGFGTKPVLVDAGVTKEQVGWRCLLGRGPTESISS